MGTSFGQALRNAIEVEKAAEEFYTRLAAATHDQEARGFLENIAFQEREHAGSIEDLAARLGAGELPIKPDFNVEVVETSPDWQYHDNISIDEALLVALDNENSAAMYYDALASSCDGDVRELFETLTRTEEEHARRIEAMQATRRA